MIIIIILSVIRLLDLHPQPSLSGARMMCMAKFVHLSIHPFYP